MKGHPYQVIITDCDHGSIQEEQEEFDRIGAELILAQVQEEKDLILPLFRSTRSGSKGRTGSGGPTSRRSLTATWTVATCTTALPG